MRGIHKAARLCVFFAIIVGKFLSTRYAKSFGIAENLFQSLSYLKKENGIGLAHLSGRESGTYPTQEATL
jgi:hypothetical protein